MTRYRSTCLVLAVCAACLGTPATTIRAQSRDAAAVPDGLKRRVEETWRVVPLQRGLLLVPRRASTRVKGIELTETEIALDGRKVTGPELVERLGADAEVVLQLSYLATDQRAALFADPDASVIERPRQAREEPAAVASFEAMDRHGHRGTRVRVFGSVRVREGEQVGNVIAVFGSIDLQGRATGDVVSVLGDVVMGPKASVGGDVVTVGGVLRAADGSIAAGKLTEVRLEWPEIRLTVPGDDQFSLEVRPDWPRIARVQWVSGLVSALLLLAICVLTVLVAPRAVSAAANPGRSFFLSALVGLAIEVLLLPAIVLIASALTLSIIGIPLLAGIPVLLLIVAFGALVGFTGMAARVGSVWRPGGQVSVSVLGVVLGLMLIWSTGLTGRYLWAASAGTSTWGAVLAITGLAIEYLCWTIGLGSAALAWMSRRSRKTVAAPVLTPPPVPVDL